MATQRWLKNINNNRVLGWTYPLSVLEHMVECDKIGNPIFEAKAVPSEELYSELDKAVAELNTLKAKLTKKEAELKEYTRMYGPLGSQLPEKSVKDSLSAEIKATAEELDNSKTVAEKGKALVRELEQLKKKELMARLETHRIKASPQLTKTAMIQKLINLESE